MDQAGACSAVPEVAPACAVQHSGDQYTTYKQPNVASALYAPTEQIWISGFAGYAGKTLNYYLKPHAASVATWSAISGPITASTVVGFDSMTSSRAYISTASTVGLYDIIIDANADGFFQPWADQIKQIEVKVPVNGDGSCYRGEAYITSENCNDQAVDCQCAPNSSCIDARYSRMGPPQYICWQAPQGPS